MKIAASLLSADFYNLEKEICLIEQAGVDSLHVDVMDGHFVPNITIGPCVIESLAKKMNLPMDVHLMINRPELSLDSYNLPGVEMIYVHAEATAHLQRALAHMHSIGKKAAVAVNPGTSLEAIQSVLSDVQRVLIMTVNPGFGGQQFIASMLPKIERLANQIAKENLSIEIAVDGGINDKTAPWVVSAGANVLVAGTAIFGQSDKAAAVARLRNCS